MENGLKLKKPAKMILRGMILCVGCTMILAALAAALVVGGILRREWIPSAAAIISALSILLSCYLTVKKAGNARLMLSLGVCAGYLITCLFVKLLFVRGEAVNMAATILPGLCAAVLAAMLANTPGKGRRRRKH